MQKKRTIFAQTRNKARMEIKKAPEADLENKRCVWLLMGYAMALSLLFIAIEWNVRDDNTDQMPLMPVYEQEIEIPIAQAPPKPPTSPPLPQEQPAATVLTVLDNRSKEEEIPLVLPEAVEGNDDGIHAGESAEEGKAAEEETVYDVVELMPEFPDGGVAGLMRYLTRHIRYPHVAQANRIQGQVLMQFIVNRDGSIVDVRVLKGVHSTLDGEAARVLSQMPRWKPGMRHGQPVRVRYTIPVVFRL